MFQFVLWAIINTPPNFLWQDLLESSFPAYHASPTTEAVLAASKEGKEGDDALNAAAVVEPRLNKRNTAVKLLLDQTIGAALNTIAFSLFIHAVQAAMPRPLGTPLSTPDQSVQFLLAGLLPSVFAPDSKLAEPSFRAFDASRVSWPSVLQRSKDEFAPIMMAGWKLWPLVSLINFTLVQSIEGRSLVGGLAGVGWGVYMSLLASS